MPQQHLLKSSLIQHPVEQIFEPPGPAASGRKAAARGGAKPLPRSARHESSPTPRAGPESQKAGKEPPAINSAGAGLASTGTTKKLID